MKLFDRLILVPCFIAAVSLPVSAQDDKPFSKAAIQHYNNAVELHTRHEFPAAEVEYKLAITHDKRLSTAWSNLGTLYLSTGKYQDACKAYEEALNIKADSELTLNGYAAALFKLGHTQRAIDMWKTCVDLHPDFTPAADCLRAASKGVGEGSIRYVVEQKKPVGDFGSDSRIWSPNPDRH